MFHRSFQGDFGLPLRATLPGKLSLIILTRYKITKLTRLIEM